MTIDLRTCRKGDPLKLRNGDVAEYDQPISKENYPHRIKLRDVHYGYMDDGTFIHDREHSFAVVEILPRKSAPIVTTEQLASAERHLDATVRVAQAARVPARTPDVVRFLMAAEAYMVGAGMRDYKEFIAAGAAYQRAEKRRKAKK